MRRTNVRLLLPLLLLGCSSGPPPCAVTADCEAGLECSTRGRCVDPDQPGACIPAGPLVVRTARVRELDLLLVLDNTAGDFRAPFVAELPRLLEGLARGQSGSESFPPLDSIRVGVVTTDMGTGPTGDCPSPFGDDGVLWASGNTANPSCLAAYPTWLEFGGDSDSPSAFATDVQCVASAVGSNGCGFEQPLEAMLKAVTPSTSPVRFAGGTVGHGDGQNAGFVRSESVLAIVHLGDEDDCSASDLTLFDPTDPRRQAGDNLCHQHPDALHPLQRYVDGLLALRDPDRLYYAVLGGVPPDAVPDESEPLTPGLEALLADPRMESRANELDPTQQLSSCELPGGGAVYPPERLTEVALALSQAGAGGWVDSICQVELADPVDRIVRGIAALFGPPCLSFARERDAGGLIACDLVEVGDAEGCGEGRRFDGLDAEGRPRCVIPQRPVVAEEPPTEPGWYYDDFSAVALGCYEGPQRIAYSGGFEPAGEVRLECPGPERVIGVGSSCLDDPTVCERAEPAVLEAFPNLTCVEVSGTCLGACTGDADCGGETRCDRERGFCTCE